MHWNFAQICEVHYSSAYRLCISVHVNTSTVQIPVSKYPLDVEWQRWKFKLSWESLITRCFFSLLSLFEYSEKIFVASRNICLLHINVHIFVLLLSGPFLGFGDCVVLYFSLCFHMITWNACSIHLFLTAVVAEWVRVLALQAESWVSYLSRGKPKS